MKKFLFSLLLSLAGVCAMAQVPSDSLPKPRLVPHLLKPFNIEAEVISFLQGHTKLAVLQVTKAEPNQWNLKPGDEILVTFMLKPQQGEPAKSGDLIRGEAIGSMNKNTVQVDYRIMRYSVTGSSKKALKAPSTHESQK